jgi:uncharacterized membrane protein
MKPKAAYIALALSLVVNAGLVGVVGGKLLSRSNSTASMQLERYGPTSDVVAAAWAKLPDDDRDILRRQLREQWAQKEGERKQLQLAGRTVYDAALKEPYDEAALRNAVIVFRTREQELQRISEDILISHLALMPPEARATAAVGLLTPFNVRMQRSDPQQGASAPPPAQNATSPKSSSIEGADLNARP